MPKSMKELELESEEIELQLKLKAAQIALERQKRKRNEDGDSGDNEILNDQHPRKKKSKKDSTKSKQSVQSDPDLNTCGDLDNTTADNNGNESPAASSSISHCGSTVDSSTSTEPSSKEYFRGLILKKRPDGMITTRPKGYYNPKSASPWGPDCADDHDGYLLFLEFIRKAVKKKLNTSIGWNEQTPAHQADFTRHVQDAYPVLRFQLTPFTIIRAASEHLGHAKEYMPKPSKNVKDPSKRKSKHRKSSPGAVPDPSALDPNAGSALLPDATPKSPPAINEPPLEPINPLYMSSASHVSTDSLPIFSEGGYLHDVPDMQERAHTTPANLVAPTDPSSMTSVTNATATSSLTSMTTTTVVTPAPNAASRRALKFKPAIELTTEPLPNVGAFPSSSSSLPVSSDIAAQATPATGSESQLPSISAGPRDRPSPSSISAPVPTPQAQAGKPSKAKRGARTPGANLTNVERRATRSTDEKKKPGAGGKKPPGGKKKKQT